MYASSRVREVERRSASSCNFVTSSLHVSKSPEGKWRFADCGGGSGQPSSSPLEEEAGCAAEGAAGFVVSAIVAVPTTFLEEGTKIRVAPMERSRGGWDEEHFHDRLRVPEGSPAGRGLVVMLEAMARECVAVALSPHPYFEMGKTYAVHLGAAGNLSTVIRRRLPSGNEAVDCTFPGRICTDDRFTPYWILLQDGVVSAGVGTCPGKRCVASLDDRLYNQLRSGIDAVKFVGIGNSALGRQARDLRVRNVRVMPLPSVFGTGGVPIDKVEAVNIDQDGRLGANAGVAAPDSDVLAEYERECAKAKARAEKFGTEYRQPPPDAFFKWSEARRLRANPERGFITGIDVTSSEEKAKAERRRARFAEDETTRKREREEDAQKGDDVGEGRAATNTGGDADDTEEDRQGADPISVEESWDNEKLVISQRIDPPRYLWEVKPDPEAPGENDGSTREGEETEEKAMLVPEKVHVFSIDWAAFKQIRSDDIMAHFAVYGPSYVEWLGELSCNVLFEDKYSASRALAGLSKSIPAPRSDDVMKEPNAMVGHYSEGTNGTEENITGSARSEDDMDGKNDAAVGTGATKADDDDGPSQEGKEQAVPEDDAPPPTPTPHSDLGAMGWRVALFPVRKVANDRFGRRGTRARILMRVATSEDVLVDRPSERLRPPPGFTTKRVLGPGSDFDTRWRQSRSRRQRRGDVGGRGGKRRKRDGGGGGGSADHRGRGRRRDYGGDDDEGEEERWERDQYQSDEDYDSHSNEENEDDDSSIDGGDDQLPKALDRGLKATRAGFTVEEMEAERAARRRAAEGGS